MIKGVQPKGNKIFPPEPKLFMFEGQEVILKIIAPMHVSRDKDGNPLKNLDGSYVMEIDKDKDGNPMTAKFWVKDQMQKQPLTWLDLASKGLNIFGIGYGLYRLTNSIDTMSGGLSKDPVIYKQETPRTDYVTSNTDGTINIDRG